MFTSFHTSEPDATTCTRSVVLLAFFLLWAALIVFRLAHFMVFDRENHLAKMARQSVFEGTIPAHRGRLLAHDGRPLVWSTRHFALHWRVPRSEALALREWEMLCATEVLTPSCSLEHVLSRPGQDVLVRQEVTADEAEAAATLQRHMPGLVLRDHFRRHRCEELPPTTHVGEVAIVDGIEVGMSGLEKAHDALLRGRAGIYRVMLDKHGRWVPETWHKVREIRPGNDVYLSMLPPPCAETERLGGAIETASSQ